MSSLDPTIPLLDYSPPEPPRNMTLPLFTAYAIAGYVAFMLLTAGCFAVAQLCGSANLLPALPVLMLAAVVASLEARPVLRAFCTGIFGAILTLCIPITLMYLLLLNQI